MGAVTKRILLQLLIILIVIIGLIALFFVGIFIGYVMIGKGSASDVFQPETWQHILDFIK